MASRKWLMYESAGVVSARPRWLIPSVGAGAAIHGTHEGNVAHGI